MLKGERLRIMTVVAAALLAALVTVLVLWGARPAEAAFSGANGLLAFSSDRTTGTGVDNPTGDYEIFTMNDGGTNLTQLTHNTSFDIAPAWSANGTQIAFVSDRADADDTIDREIYKMDANGENEVAVTRNTADDANPVWSPVLSSGGTKIAFTSMRGNYDIYMISPNGSNEVRLTKSTALDAYPAWSPNGKKIAFHSTRLGSNNYEVYAMKPRPEGKRNRPVNLSRHSSNDEYPNWSPDGTQIAFRSQRGVGGDHEIYVMDADGTDQSPVTENRSFDYDPTWSPDGTQITFTRLNSPESGGFEVYKVGASGDPETNVTNNSANDQSPDWQPVPATSGG